MTPGTKELIEQTGDLISILNSDDVYAPRAFENCAKILVASVLRSGGLGRLSDLSDRAAPRK